MAPSAAPPSFGAMPCIHGKSMPSTDAPRRSAAISEIGEWSRAATSLQRFDASGN